MTSRKVFVSCFLAWFTCLISFAQRNPLDNSYKVTLIPSLKGEVEIDLEDAEDEYEEVYEAAINYLLSGPPKSVVQSLEYVDGVKSFRDYEYDERSNEVTVIVESELDYDTLLDNMESAFDDAKETWMKEDISFPPYSYDCETDEIWQVVLKFDGLQLLSKYHVNFKSSIDQLKSMQELLDSYTVLRSFSDEDTNPWGESPEHASRVYPEIISLRMAGAVYGEGHKVFDKIEITKVDLNEKKRKVTLTFFLHDSPLECDWSKVEFVYDEDRGVWESKDSGAEDLSDLYLYFLQS